MCLQGSEIVCHLGKNIKAHGICSFYRVCVMDDLLLYFGSFIAATSGFWMLLQKIGYPPRNRHITHTKIW
jgi:hypothetical protein